MTLTWIHYWVRCLFGGFQSFFIWIGGSDALFSGVNILCFDQYEREFFLWLDYQDQSLFHLFTGWSKNFCLVRTEKIRVLVSRLHHCEDALAFRYWSWGSSSWHPLWKVYKVCQPPSQVFRHPNLREARTWLYHGSVFLSTNVGAGTRFLISRNIGSFYDVGARLFWKLGCSENSKANFCGPQS